MVNNSGNINEKMVKCTLWYLAVLFTLLEVFVRTQISVRDTTHGFIQNNNEVRYLVDDISTIHKEFSPGIRNSKIYDARFNSYLRFEPEFLDFKERPLGVPHLEKVTLFNINSNKSVEMSSISGNTVHFHSSFFEDKKIPPLGNTTFNVVFLGREEGEIESNLYIHTTEGSYKYQVRGVSVASPYRLRPIVDIKIPLNASFSPLIYMHNPHTEPIQIVEVYSSGGEFHLELPTGELEGPKGMWEIPPFQTKPIIRVRFHARTESNYTAYVRIKVNGMKDVLVVPLEVEVSAQCALHTPQGTIDFGVGGTLDKPKQVKLMVYNTLKKTIKIHSVSTTTKSIQIDYQPVKIPPDSRELVEIATLTLDWKKAYEAKNFFGKITIKYKAGKSELDIPFWATIFEGGLFYNASITKYLTDKASVAYETRNFTVVNKYEYPLAVTNVTLADEAQLYFSINKFKPYILKPSESTILFQLTLKSNILSDFKLKSFLFIHTNISSIQVPLLCYNGKLTMIFPGISTDILDLGLVGSESEKETYFTVKNNNPVEVKLIEFGDNIQSGTVRLVGCSSDPYVLNNVYFSSSINMSKCTNLKPGESGVFQVTIQTSKTERQVLVQSYIQTQFENIVIPIRFKVAHGKLEIGPDRLVFDECFPGKICSHPLRIHSTFVDPMIIQSIASVPPDLRLTSSYTGHITSRSTKIIGHLFLDPSLGCKNHCYTGLSLNSTVGNQWLKTFPLPENTAELDLSLLNIYYGRYLNLTSAGRKWQNLTLKLDTTEVREHYFHTRVKMNWPKLIVGGTTYGNRSVFMFPLTQIGTTTFRNISIRNPSNGPLTVQLVMDWSYPNIKSLIQNLPTTFIPNEEEPYHSDSFFFHDSHAENRSRFTSKHNIFTHSQSVPFEIAARDTAHVTIGFKASLPVLKSAFIFIRNNLTILEVVRLTGQGAVPSFKFGNRKPGSTMPLLFELTEKHLRDCEKEKNRKNPVPNLTVKRSFTARNTGDISVKITGFFINNFACEGYGFKILNCVPFELTPNTTKKIDIAFTPDFTLSKIQRTLVLETSLNMPVNYTLITTLPPYFLVPCASVLARPSWEPMLYYACVSLMLFLLITIIIICFIETNRILRSTIIIRNDIDTQPLDLRLIGTQTRAEIRNKPDLEISDSSQSSTTTTTANNKKPIENGKINNWTPETKEIPSPQISTNPKSKKKVSKKNSVESQPEILTPAEPPAKAAAATWNVFLKTPQNKPKYSPSSENCSEGKKSPSILNSKNEVLQKKAAVVVSPKEPKKLKKPKDFEEDTSSTTTESSNNDEFIEKTKKLPCRKNKSPTFDDEPLLTFTELEKEPPPAAPVTNRWKSRNENINKMHEQPHNNKSVLENRQQKSKSNRERKERAAQKRRDKNKNQLQHLDQHPLIPARISPPMPPIGVWGENRATFSDVVARSDSAAYKPNPTIIQKPTLYVEPTQKQRELKHSPNELGPIGSKKCDSLWADSSKSYSPSLQANTSLKPVGLSNSYFTEPQHIPQDTQNTYFDLPEIWNPQDATNLFQNQKDTASPEIPPSLSPFQENWSSATFWEPLCAPVGETRPPQPLPTDYYWNTQAPASLWSMSPWTPVLNPPDLVCDAPPPTQMPVRSPPGFHRDDNDTTRMQGFDPFNSLSNIWTPQNPDTWNYNNRNNNN